MEKKNATKQNMLYHLHRLLSRNSNVDNIAHRITPGVWIVTQGLQLLQEYKDLHQQGEKYAQQSREFDIKDIQEYTEQYILLIKKFMVLGSKLVLLKEYRIDSRDIKQENEQEVEQSIQAYTDPNIDVQRLNDIISCKNIDINWQTQVNQLEDLIEDYIDITGLYGDCLESSFDLVPEYGLTLDNISSPIRWLDELGHCSMRTAQTQLMINHCIQIIVGVVNVLNDSIPSEKSREQEYKQEEKNRKSIFGEQDYLLFLCQDLEYGVQQGTIGYQGLPTSFYSLGTFVSILSKIYRLDGVRCGDYDQNNSDSGQQKQTSFYNLYPIWQQSFDDPLEYFSSTCKGLVFDWIMFANVPHTAKYQQMLKIRSQIKQLTILGDQIKDLEENCKVEIINYVIMWVNINNIRFSPYHRQENQKFSQQKFDSLVTQNPVVKHMAEKYLEIYQQPFELLEELFHGAREKRARLLGLGHQIGELSSSGSISADPEIMGN